MPVQRYKLTLAYQGTHYHGWQSQAANPATWKGPWPEEGEGIPSIQETVARTIQEVVGHPVQVVGSSRTDAGVHAKGQIAHFDTDQVQIPPEGLRKAVNSRLPEDILIRLIEPVDESFHAIKSTLSKRYQYYVWTAPERPVFGAGLCWHRWQALDDAAMAQAASLLVGEHDFASFAKPGHNRSTTVRTILGCDVSRRGPRLVFGVEGTGFLWNMVRIIVGTLVEVGLGRHAPSAIATMLAARDRRATGGTAPAHGLYLQWIRVAPTPAKT
jgi:tRNA pseudouridine38-40 synthase